MKTAADAEKWLVKVRPVLQAERRFVCEAKKRVRGLPDDAAESDILAAPIVSDEELAKWTGEQAGALLDRILREAGLLIGGLLTKAAMEWLPLSLEEKRQRLDKAAGLLGWSKVADLVGWPIEKRRLDA